uniref:Beta-defensin-like domain-containing protein n=1 Tax=Myotis lucifugus TaxID=59463 RepID=G1QB82_MYOLU
MRLLHILLLPLCLLFTQVGPGAGLLANLIPRSPKCSHQGGICYLYACPAGTKEIAMCYRANARCCI